MTTDRPLELVVRPSRPVDLVRTLTAFRLVAGDPAFRVAADGVWRATNTPHGPATMRAASTAADGAIHFRFWGQGAEWLGALAPLLIGEADQLHELADHHPLVTELHRRHPHIRMGRSNAIVESLVPVILGQKVTTIEASRGYAALVRRFGEPAPGPGGLRLAPTPARMATLGYAELHPCGIERRRAETILRVCRRADRLEALSVEPPAEARRVLECFAGIGPWTSASVTLVTHGDPDAVIVGDYHLPHLVAYALAGERRATDARMLELLEPYRGQRARVAKLLMLSGRKPERRAPKRPLRHLARL
jgi:3-methyladenine DNA glycosylase/8-oxoguanine DNA glycosylase